MQDIGQLKRILQMTLGPTQESINQGEALLNQQSRVPSFASTMMLIVDDPQCEIEIRQAAVVNLKTFLENSWKPKEGAFVLPENEKEIIRGTLVDALIRCVSQKKLRVQYEDLVYKLAARDYPQQWPSLLPTIAEKLAGMRSFEDMLGALLALRRLSECYQFLMDEDRLPLYQIIAQTFPILEGVFQKSLENFNEQTSLLVKAIMKSFYHCTHLELPDYLANMPVIEKWFSFFAVILKAPVPQELLPITFVEKEIVERNKHFVWTTKHWAAKIMAKFAQKYFNETFVKDTLIDFSRAILKTFAPSFMEVFFHMLLQNSQFIGSKVSLYALKFLYYCLKMKFTRELIGGHLDKLLFEVAVPRMQLTPFDDQLWKSDPEEYIRKLDDFTVAAYNNKNAANDLFRQVCLTKDNNGNEYLLSFLNYCSACFNSGTDPRNGQPVGLLLKEALLWGIESLSDRILKTAMEGMEQLLERYVLPELQSPIGFLRARACTVIQCFESSIQNKANVLTVVQGIYNCILDKELPVSVAAAQSFSAILAHDVAKEMVRPGLSKILEIYLNLMNIIDNEHLVSSLESIVNTFSSEIAPFAEQLITQLVGVFHKYCKKQNQGMEESDDDGEAELAAAGCLEAIKKILASPLNDQTYRNLEEILFPIFNFCFTEQGCDFVQEALELLTLLVFKAKNGLSPGLWFYFPVLAQSVMDLRKNVGPGNYCTGFTPEQCQLLDNCNNSWGKEFLKHMIVCFRNYIQKGGDALLQGSDMFSTPMMRVVFQMATGCAGDDDESDTNAVISLFITLIENYKGRIDHLVEPILQLALANLQKNKSKRYRVVNFSVVLMLCWYNPRLTVSLLNSLGVTDQLFTNLVDSISSNFTYENDLHILFLGICSLYTLGPEELPPSLVAQAAMIGRQMLKLTSQILDLREEEESSDDDDDEEDDIKDRADYKRTLQKLQQFRNNDDEEDDDYDDGEDKLPFEDFYHSPTEEIDGVLLFEQLLLNLAEQNPPLHHELTSQFSEEDRGTLVKNIEEAKKQYQAWLSQNEHPK